MEEKVLMLLREKTNMYVSGEEVSRTLQVSRTAIWKYIGRLREKGYTIDSSPRRGYCLRAVPDLLIPFEIRHGLTTELLGRKIYAYATIDSTNRRARELAQDGASDGTIVVAEMQTEGRGRLGREWNSPQGGIWLSLILRPQIQPFKVQSITLLTAVVAAETTELIADVAVGIKWPNDLLLHGKKVAGILTEVSAEMDCVRYLIVGIGLNANVAITSFPESVKDIATSLLVQTGQAVQRTEWVRIFLQRFEQEYNYVVQHGFSAILKRWREYSITLGQDVVVHCAGQRIVGHAVDINEQGALLVETANGIEAFWAGEVSLHNE
ncbi:MAG: biotin--[acetyl-CoA-carboxylase] ligase [Firmicutes bacterium]|nr:biotin--[acetyl-CoA-carboxylase] ligase [Bacillota bacterium]